MFRFKKFSVQHDQVGMKIGTDGVLLGAWTSCSQARNILDVGTGSGLIALMMAQKNERANIVSIDIHKKAFEFATSNFLESPWSDRLTAMHGDFLEHQFDQRFDLIVSNPPFFENGMSIDSEARMMARDASFLPLDKMIGQMASLLADQGVISLIVPIDREPVIMNAAMEHTLFVSRRTEVFPNPTKKANRLLLELGNQKVTTEFGEFVVNRSEGGYSPQHKELTKDFYLKG